MPRRADGNCSKCGGPNERENHAYCKKCVAKAMRKSRKEAREQRQLLARSVRALWAVVRLAAGAGLPEGWSEVFSEADRLGERTTAIMEGKQ